MRLRGPATALAIPPRHFLRPASRLLPKPAVAGNSPNIRVSRAARGAGGMSADVRKQRKRPAPEPPRGAFYRSGGMQELSTDSRARQDLGQTRRTGRRTKCRTKGSGSSLPDPAARSAARRGVGRSGGSSPSSRRHVLRPVLHRRLSLGPVPGVLVIPGPSIADRMDPLLPSGVRAGHAVVPRGRLGPAGISWFFGSDRGLRVRHGWCRHAYCEVVG